MKIRHFIDQYSNIIETDATTYTNLYNRYKAREGVVCYEEINSDEDFPQLFKYIEDYDGCSWQNIPSK